MQPPRHNNKQPVKGSSSQNRPTVKNNKKKENKQLLKRESWNSVKNSTLMHCFVVLCYDAATSDKETLPFVCLSPPVCLVNKKSVKGSTRVSQTFIFRPVSSGAMLSLLW